VSSRGGGGGLGASSRFLWTEPPPQCFSWVLLSPMSVTHKERLGATHSLHSGPMAPNCWKVVPGVQMTLKIKGGGLEAAQLGPGAVKAIADLVERSLNQAARCVVFAVLAGLLAGLLGITV
jgi:hypothetical protein